ncbi:MAG: hypothetical protein QOC60_1849 [Frankiaceae bacterium]|nr:hypothetical protein [Frankiaceae bacterium]
MSRNILTGGKRAAARCAVVGLSVLTLAAPSALAQATTVVASAPSGDAVTTFSLSPATDTRAAGQGHVINVTGMAAVGTPVAGVTPLGVVAGPNATAPVTCTATNASGASTCTFANTNVGDDSVTIYVNKSTGAGPQLETGELRAVVTRTTTAVVPVITVPADITVPATSASGAVVSFTVTSTIGSATCDHVSGSTFPIGTTTVVCSTGSGTAVVTKSFHVTVTAPSASTVTIVVPKRIQVVVKSPAKSAVVVFVTSARDSADGVLAVTCDHPSGSVFLKGETRVTCWAQNSRGTVATAYFHIVVKVESRHEHKPKPKPKHDHKDGHDNDKAKAHRTTR